MRKYSKLRIIEKRPDRGRLGEKKSRGTKYLAAPTYVELSGGGRRVFEWKDIVSTLKNWVWDCPRARITEWEKERNEASLGIIYSLRGGEGGKSPRTPLKVERWGNEHLRGGWGKRTIYGQGKRTCQKVVNGTSK